MPDYIMVLFVGGPKDGETLLLPREKNSVVLYLPRDKTVEHIIDKLTKDWAVARPVDQSLEETLQLLVQGYTQHKLVADFFKDQLNGG